MDRLEDVLGGRAHLDLTGQILDMGDEFAGFGGSCNLFVAWYEDVQHGRTKVAVKQMRVSMREDKRLAKVCGEILFCAMTLADEKR